MVGESSNRFCQLGHVGGCAVDVLGHGGLRFQKGIHEHLHGLRGKGGLLVRRGKDIASGVQRFHDIPDEIHEFVGLGLAGETADFHSTAEGVDNYITCYFTTTFNFNQFGYS